MRSVSHKLVERQGSHFYITSKPWNSFRGREGWEKSQNLEVTKLVLTHGGLGRFWQRTWQRGSCGLRVKACKKNVAPETEASHSIRWSRQKSSWRSQCGNPAGRAHWGMPAVGEGRASCPDSRDMEAPGWSLGFRDKSDWLMKSHCGAIYKVKNEKDSKMVNVKKCIGEIL